MASPQEIVSLSRSLSRSNRRRGGIRNKSKIRYTREKTQQQQQQAPLSSSSFESSSSSHSSSSTSLSSGSYNDTVERAASAHAYAQKLNNIAAMCIEIGQLGKAILSLNKALKMTELHMTDQLLDRSEACTCCDCSIDGCIAYSEQHSSNIVDDMFDVVVSSPKSKKKRKISSTGFKNYSADATYRSIMNGKNSKTTVDFNNGLLYKRPIRIPKKSIREGHNMGRTLFLIITFNLALAHHLKAMMKKKNDDDIADSSKLLSITVPLYELVNHWQNPFPNDDNDDEEEHLVSDTEDDSMSTSYETEGNDDGENEEYIHLDLHIADGKSKRFNRILYSNLTHLNQLMIKKIDVEGNNSSSSPGIVHKKKRLNDLMINVAPPAVTTDDESERSSSCNDTDCESSNIAATTATTTTTTIKRHKLHSLPTKQGAPAFFEIQHNTTRPKTSHSSSRTSDPDDILEFEYYNEKEEDEHYNNHGRNSSKLFGDQQCLASPSQRRCSSSASSSSIRKQTKRWRREESLREDRIIQNGNSSFIDE